MVNLSLAIHLQNHSIQPFSKQYPDEYDQEEVVEEKEEEEEKE